MKTLPAITKQAQDYIREVRTTLPQMVKNSDFVKGYNDPYNPQIDDSFEKQMGQFVGGSPVGGTEHAFVAGAPVLLAGGMKIVNSAEKLPEELGTGTKLLRYGGQLVDSKNIDMAAYKFGNELRNAKKANLVQISPRKYILDALAEATK